MKLQVLSTPGCAECAVADRIIEKVKPDYPDLEVEHIDVAQDRPDLAAQYGLLSAPGIVIDGEMELFGLITEQQLRRKLDQHATVAR